MEIRMTGPRDTYWHVITGSEYSHLSRLTVLAQESLVIRTSPQNRTSSLTPPPNDLATARKESLPELIFVFVAYQISRLFIYKTGTVFSSTVLSTSRSCRGNTPRNKSS